MQSPPADYWSVSSAHAHWPGMQRKAGRLRSGDLNKAQQSPSCGRLTYSCEWDPGVMDSDGSWVQYVRHEDCLFGEKKKKHIPGNK